MTPAGKRLEAILVKLYAQSRFYDTTNRRYVSLADIRAWAAKGVAFSVIYARTGEDVTRKVL